MNKKEVSEIKKQFTPDNCAITRICGCYVDGEKNKKTQLKEAFLARHCPARLEKICSTWNSLSLRKMREELRIFS